MLRSVLAAGRRVILVRCVVAGEGDNFDEFDEFVVQTKDHQRAISYFQQETGNSECLNSNDVALSPLGLDASDPFSLE